MGMKNIVPKIWDWEWEGKTVLASFGIGNRNEKQCSRPKLGKNWLKSLGKMLGTGIPAHAWVAPVDNIAPDDKNGAPKQWCTLGLLNTQKSRIHWICQREQKIGLIIKKIYIKKKKKNVSLVTCYVSYVACHLSLMSTATDLNPANSATMHSRLVCKNPTNIFFFKRKNLQISPKQKWVLSFAIRAIRFSTRSLQRS